jgi:hypothetical protein
VHARPADLPPLGTIRSLHYFLPVIDEARTLDPDYLGYTSSIEPKTTQLAGRVAATRANSHLPELSRSRQQLPARHLERGRGGAAYGPLRGRSQRPPAHPGAEARRGLALAVNCPRNRSSPERNRWPASAEWPEWHPRGAVGRRIADAGGRRGVAYPWSGERNAVRASQRGNVLDSGRLTGRSLCHVSWHMKQTSEPMLTVRMGA